MAKIEEKIKKTTINQVDSVIKKTYKPTESFEWNDITINVTKTLSFQNVLKFVKSVTQGCFAVDTNEYLPEVKDFLFKVNVLEMYGNIAIPTNIEHKYAFVYHTDLVSKIYEHINKEQLSVLKNGIDAKLQHMAQSRIDEVTNQINEIYTQIDGVQNQFKNIFESVNQEDIQAFTKLLAGGDIQENIVKAYIKEKNNEAL